MICCGGAFAGEGAETVAGTSTSLRRAEMAQAGHRLADGRVHYLIAAPDLASGDIARVERALRTLEGVTEARVNLSLRRVGVTLDGPGRDPLPLLETLAALGLPAMPVDADDGPGASAGRESTRLLAALAVAGFAAANIMLMSVSVWAGADGEMRQLFHLVSALIAVPVVAYSGQPFFRSALAALRAGRVNMDVPISLGVLLTLGLSLVETAQGGEDAFFDAAVTLLFFLLIGRYLDQRMRARARSAVTGLARLAARGAMRIRGDRTLDYLALDEIEPGMVLRLAAGERVPVDARVIRGESRLDRALVTGESAPVPVGPGDALEAGTLNLGGVLDIRTERPAAQSFLAEVTAMLAAAEQDRGRYAGIADRAARLYAPVLHLLAALTFAFWLVATGDLRLSLFVAISVLIVTCPCALGLAVPAVHVIGAGRLFEIGVLARDGSALERLAEIDRVVLDKTGTLTTGTPRVVASGPGPDAAAAARALALASTHPAAVAIADHLAGTPPAALDRLREIAGHGVEGWLGARRVRLGRADWVAEIAAGEAPEAGPAFALEGEPAVSFALAETLREGAVEACAALEAAGLAPEIVSGDAETPVRAITARLGLARALWGQRPADKIARIRALEAEGHRVLVVGDGLNDAPALASGHVSMAPARAADAARLAAGLVFTRPSLQAVPQAHRLALQAALLVRQNLALAVVYNCLAVPLAVAGQVTPLIAALAMSGSSILVVGNSLRLMRFPLAPRPAPERRDTLALPARRPRPVSRTRAAP